MTLLFHIYVIAGLVKLAYEMSTPLRRVKARDHRVRQIERVGRLFGW